MTAEPAIADMLVTRPSRPTPIGGRGEAGDRRPRPTARPVARRHGDVPRRGTDAMAALDLGSNNCRLLVARTQDDGFRVIDAFSRMVRLGEGVGTTGRLSSDAMARSLEALRICAAKLSRWEVARSRAVVTEAGRRATNFEQFRGQVRDETAIELEVICGREESRLALAGCAPLLDPARPRAIAFDIGGGSTEVIWLEVVAGPHDAAAAAGYRLIDSISLPVGVVSLTEACAGPDIDCPTYDQLCREIGARLAPFEAMHGIGRAVADGKVQMLGSSGTVTTLAAVRRRLPRYDRAKVDGTYLDFTEVFELSRQLIAQGYRGRAAHPCIGLDRAELLVAGCAVLEAICRQWPIGRLRIADRGIREGILHDLMAERGAGGGLADAPHAGAAADRGPA